MNLWIFMSCYNLTFFEFQTWCDVFLSLITMINLHDQEAVTNFLTTLVHRHFRKWRRKNDLWWWLNLLGNTVTHRGTSINISDMFVQFSVCALWEMWRGQRLLMRPSSPTSATTWRSHVMGVTRWSSRAATPPSSDETGQTSSSSRPSRRMKEHIIVTQTTRLWRRLTWYSQSQTMCHFRSQTLPSKILKITRIPTTYGENNWWKKTTEYHISNAECSESPLPYPS